MTRDELILIGVNAEREKEGLPPLAADHPWTDHHAMVRAALEAVAPMILEEAANALPGDLADDQDPWGHGYNAALEQSRAATRALKGGK